MTSDMYTQEMGPKDQEKMADTRKRKKTPAMERLRLVPSWFWELMTPSQIRAHVIPMVPKRRGLRRPTRSRMKTMKIKSEGETLANGFKGTAEQGNSGLEIRTC